MMMEKVKVYQWLIPAFQRVLFSIVVSEQIANLLEINSFDATLLMFINNFWVFTEFGYKRGYNRKILLPLLFYKFHSIHLNLLQTQLENEQSCLSLCLLGSLCSCICSMVWIPNLRIRIWIHYTSCRRCPCCLSCCSLDHCLDFSLLCSPCLRLEEVDRCWVSKDFLSVYASLTSQATRLTFDQQLLPGLHSSHNNNQQNEVNLRSNPIKFNPHSLDHWDNEILLFCQNSHLK